MRVLEHCAPSASEEVQVQINALREAFSQDTSKPFELKPNLGLRSPASDSYPTPATMPASHHPSLHATPSWQHLQEASSSKTVSPTSDFAPAYDSTTVPAAMPYTSVPVPSQTSYPAASVPQTSSPLGTAYPLDATLHTADQQAPVWDPSGIFQQWNTAFGAQAPPQQSPITDPRMAPPTAPMLPTQQPAAPQHPMFAARQTPPNAMSDMSMPTVTPVMWQDAFTNAYVSGHGHKRYREGSADYGQYKRRG